MLTFLARETELALCREMDSIARKTLSTRYVEDIFRYYRVIQCCYPDPVVTALKLLSNRLTYLLTTTAYRLNSVVRLRSSARVGMAINVNLRIAWMNYVRFSVIRSIKLKFVEHLPQQGRAHTEQDAASYTRVRH